MARAHAALQSPRLSICLCVQAATLASQLLVAVRTRDLPSMRRLCARKSENLTAALRRRDGQGHTLMHWAAKAGDVEGLELLAGESLYTGLRQKVPRNNINDNNDNRINNNKERKDKTTLMFYVVAGQRFNVWVRYSCISMYSVVLYFLSIQQYGSLFRTPVAHAWLRSPTLLPNLRDPLRRMIACCT